MPRDPKPQHLETLRRNSPVFAQSGYGAGGPMNVPADTRSIRSGGHVERGYGTLDAYGGLVIGPGPSFADEGSFGDATSEESAAGWAASAVAGSGTSMVWTGVAVGLSVWLLTKILDRTFFDKRERGHHDDAGDYADGR